MRGNMGLLTVAQAAEHDVGRRALSRAVQRGELARLRTRVYAGAGMQPDWFIALAADLRACKAPAWAAYGAAMRLHGLSLPGFSRLRELVVVGTARPTVAGGVAVHRTKRLDSVDRSVVRGIPTTSAERTMVDMARRVSRRRRLLLLDDAIMGGIVDRRRMHERAVALANGRKGVATLVRATEPGAEQRFKSKLERKGARLVRQAGITDFAVNIIPRHAPDAGSTDVVCEAAGLIIDWDGLRFHRDPRARQRDNDKSNAAVTGGYTPLRFTWDDVTHRRDYVVGTIRRAVHARTRQAA